MMSFFKNSSLLAGYSWLQNSFDSIIINFFLKFSTIVVIVLDSINRRLSRFSFLKNTSWRALVLALFLVALILDTSLPLQLSTLPTTSGITPLRSNSSSAVNLNSVRIFPLLFLIVIFLYDIGKSKLRFKLLRFELYLIIFFLIQILATIQGFNISSSVLELLRFTLSLVVYFVASRLKITKSSLYAILFISLCIILFEGGLAMAQFLKGGTLGLPIEEIEKIDLNEFSFQLEGTNYFRVVGTFYQPNLLSTFLALFLPFAVALFYLSKGYLKALSIFGIFLGVITIALSLSRMGMIACLLSLGLGIFLLEKNKETSRIGFSRIKLSILIIVSGLLIALQNPFIESRFLTFNSSENSWSTRKQLISESLYIAQNFPLGSGPNTFLYIFTNYDITQTHLSSRYLEPVLSLYFLLLSEVGVAGLLMFLIIITEVIVLFIRNHSYLKREKRIIAIACFCAVVAYLISGILDLRPLVSRQAWLFFFLMGLCVNLIGLRKRNN